MRTFAQTPDKPDSFGYKIAWFAVKATEPATVVDALELGEATPANWASGLAAAYEYSRGSEPWLFVSPPISGWVLAVSFWLPYPSGVEAYHEIGKRFDTLFSRLIGRFDDVQFFASHRASDFCAWARATRGKPVRVFAYADGEVLANFGEQTREEAKLGLANLTGLSPPQADDEISRIVEEQDAEEEKLIASGLSQDQAWERIRQNGYHAFPDDSDVVELAALWSIDPTRLSDDDHPADLGLAVRLPENLRQ
jgi:hypothetical protein